MFRISKCMEEQVLFCRRLLLTFRRGDVSTQMNEVFCFRQAGRADVSMTSRHLSNEAVILSWWSMLDAVCSSWMVALWFSTMVICAHTRVGLDMDMVVDNKGEGTLLVPEL